MLINKKQIKINEKFFIISMIPAYYALKLIPKLQEILENPPEDYNIIEEFMFKLMSYCRFIDQGKCSKIDQKIIDEKLSPDDIIQLQEKLLFYNQDFLVLGRS